MPADYHFEFVAHIDRLRKPEKFPNEVYVRELYQQIPSDEDVKKLYNHRFNTLITQPGIVVFLDSEETIDSGLTFDKRMYIPWHMVTYFHGTVRIVTPQPTSTPLESLLPQEMEPEPDDSKKLVN